MLLGFQLSLCVIISTFAAVFYNQKWGKLIWENYHITESLVEIFFQKFASYFLLFTTIIPISLIISLEVVKGFQAYFINNDSDLFSVEKG